jgi:ADP-heptose:LPS heptosyltransferase
MLLAPSLTSLLLMWASGAQHRIGVAQRGIDCAFTLLVDAADNAVHHNDRSAALLAAFGVDRRGIFQGDSVPLKSWCTLRPQLFLSATERSEGEDFWQRDRTAAARLRGLRLVVNVSAGSAERYWPESRFVATVKHIRQRFARVEPLVIGSPNDVERMQRVASAIDAQVAHTPHYRQMMAIVAACDVVLTADTSVTHIASAFGKPAVAMFVGGGGPLFGPYATCGQFVSTYGASLECMPVEPVIAALVTVIERQQALRSEPSRQAG